MKLGCNFNLQNKKKWRPLPAIGGPIKLPIPWHRRMRPYARVNLSNGISWTRMTGVKENVEAKNTPNRADAVTSNGHDLMHKGIAAVARPHIARQKA